MEIHTICKERESAVIATWSSLAQLHDVRQDGGSSSCCLRATSRGQRLKAASRTCEAHDDVLPGWRAFFLACCMQPSQRGERALRRGLVKPLLAVAFGQMAAVSVSGGVREVGRPAFLFFFFLRLVIGSVEAVASEAGRAATGENKKVKRSRHGLEQKVEIIIITLKHTACCV